MNYERKLLAAIRRADFNFGLIEKGDKILVGVSGGKDSLALIRLLSVYNKFQDKDFEFKACFLDLGFPKTDRSGIIDFCKSINVELIFEDCSDVYPILKQHMTSTNILPCSICSRMKKASINAVAKRLGFNKVAFAHHADDAIETLLMNMTHGGRVATFSPMMKLERADITFIRPLIYAREKDIKGYVREAELPVIKSTCGNDKTSERATVKALLDSYYSKYKDAYDNFLTMMTNVEKFDLWFDDYGYADGEGLFIKKVKTYRDFIDSLDIRREVFVLEQQIPSEEEIDGSDVKDAIYYVAYLNKVPVATLRLLPLEKGHYKLGRLAVKKEYRKKGIAKALVHYVEKELSHHSTPVVITLGGQESARPFYESIGYVVDGPEYYEVNIKHFPMRKEILKPIMDKAKSK